MAVRNLVRNLFAIYSLSCLTIASAQTTSPQNGTLPVPLSLPQLKLTSSQTALATAIDVDPLTTLAGLNATVQTLGEVAYEGFLVLTTPTNAPKIPVGSFAYISCDPSAYSGNLNAVNVIRSAVLQIQGSDISNPNGAIVLYSTTSEYCNYNPLGLSYPWVFTTVNTSAAAILETALKSPSPAGSSTTIKLDQSSINNTGGNSLGPSPTTAVAMIILYSITGIITALFLIIIVTGAIRAHRHPERYGPRNVIGRPRQSRAKGIARAMLETLPIVKFGESEDANKPMPMPGDGDLELGETSQTAANQSGRTGSSTIEEPRQESQISEGGEIIRTVKVDGDDSSHDHQHDEEHEKSSEDSEHKHEDGHEHAAGDSHYHPNVTEGSDNGLACSVCTDDFVKGQDIRVLPCGHKFHPECIDPWLLNVSGTCPLCRIDLRPTASHTEGEDGPMPMPMPDMADIPEGDDMPITDMPPEMAAAETGRRRHNGLALYLQHTLNVRRMRDATPEERIAALRRFRTARRATNGDASDSMPMPMPVGTRARMTARLNRLWPHSVHGASEPAMPETGMPETETNEGHRNSIVI